MNDKSGSMFIKKANKFLLDKNYRFLLLAAKGFFDWMSDEEYLKRKFKASLGYELNLDSPKAFNEKIQWLKLHDRKPEYTTMVDKYKVKKYIANVLDKKYVIPTYGIWNDFDEINFGQLPNQFVLKCTHDSGGVVIVKDKSKMDKKAIKKQLEQCMKKNFYYPGREWPYKNVRPRILAEKYMKEHKKGASVLRDYKFFCFHGVPMLCEVISDRFEQKTIDFFDMEWNHQDIKRLFSPGLPCEGHSEIPIQKPEAFAEMKVMAKTISKGINFVRVDLYECNGMPYFGEITFYPASGFGLFEPDIWNTKLGELISLDCS